MTQVSVVIPVHNGANCVAGAIESVLAQTHQDFEVIVVDDGSGDGTKEVVESFTDSRITCIRQENSGVSRARNTGIARAKGEYIAFLDADDRWRPSKLARTMAAFNASPESGLVYSQAYAVGETGQCLYVAGRIMNWGVDSSYQLSRLLLRNFILTPSVVVVKRECCQRIGGFDETLRHAEDWDYWLRLAKLCPLRDVAGPLVDFTVMRGEKLLRKMSARDAQRAQVQVVEKAGQRGGVSDPVLRSALAFAWLQGALIDLALGQVNAGRCRLARALEYEDNLFSKHEALVIEYVIGLASQLIDGRQSFEHGERFIRLVWTVLPRKTSAKRQMRKALSAFYARQYFRAYRRGDAQTSRAVLWPMVASEPHWLADRGFWSIAIEAYLGRRVADRVRRPQPNRLQAKEY